MAAMHQSLNVKWHVFRHLRILSLTERMNYCLGEEKSVILEFTPHVLANSSR